MWQKGSRTSAMTPGPDSDGLVDPCECFGREARRGRRRWWGTEGVILCDWSLPPAQFGPRADIMGPFQESNQSRPFVVAYHGYSTIPRPPGCNQRMKFSDKKKPLFIAKKQVGSTTRREATLHYVKTGEYDGDLRAHEGTYTLAQRWKLWAG